MTKPSFTSQDRPVRRQYAPPSRRTEADRRAASLLTVESIVTHVDSIREASRLIMHELAHVEVGDRVQAQSSLTLRLRTAISKMEQESLQELVDAIEPRRPIATRIELERRTIETIMTGSDWLSAAEIGRLLDPEAVNPHAAVSRWQASGRIFGIEHRGRKMYPTYIFDATWQPLTAVKKILSTLADDSPFKIAAWFESTNSLLGGKRPRELIARDPDVVLAAAKDHLVGAVHG